ncbi:uncharacterized protein K444DRAFT_113805 [Hyaloscypha bicolor E]|uniref:Uncharacterized protein n=1 Tax=Hyaloscypha bicolor E TaxID=1095630 RepID=A0A2J6SVJ1_9HELO|nr:uncharacterized protein K444DRAFT_113805 [Hyaloscypha bicolor E]PMD54791.1 hypothetical protein K444DRAFT_113805 [Hyaloscypha bicolor E]
MSPSGSSSAISVTPIAHPFGLHPRGRDAITSFPNNVTNINSPNYTWVKGTSNYTLYHNVSGEPTQALLWLIGNIDGTLCKPRPNMRIGPLIFCCPPRRTRPWITCSTLVHGKSLRNRIATPYSALFRPE